MHNLCLELATVGDLKLCERPQCYTLAPGESKHVKANIKVSSTETGMNPCLRLDVGAGKMMNTCLPGAHVLAAWHSLAAEALKPLFQHPDLRLVSGLTLTLTPIIPLPLPIALAQAPSR